MWDNKYNAPRLEKGREKRLTRHKRIMKRFTSNKRPSDLGYAAGLVDGEGCILINKQAHGYTLQIRVGMGSTKAVSFMHKTFGGSLRFNQSSKMHTWVLSSMEAEGFLRAVLLFLKVKKAEAIVALSFRDHVLETRLPGKRLSIDTIAKREAYRLKLQELKNG